ncbi:MAG TPA: nicotinate-nucleotide diphosphorylase, partial [Pseudomonadaceae bacterium]|nr:nicotinate-nucleotide diphosphorylase [Pseudomonadaceae bacterium]
MHNTTFFQGLEQTVAAALAEDLGSGDITAELVPASQRAQAQLICRETAVLCGRPWVDEVFRQVDADIVVEWHLAEGEALHDGCIVFT